jgi:hypothetical protein
MTYLGKGVILLKHLNEGVASQGVTQDAQISPGCCDVTTTFRARQNLLDQIILQLPLCVCTSGMFIFVNYYLL